MKLHRPYIRKEVREEVERRAEKNEQGQFLDANTHEPIEGKYDLGHKYGHENAREIAKAEQENLTQEEFNDRMNDPDLYQIEDPSSNRSHKYEMTDRETHEEAEEEAGNSEGWEEASDEGQGETAGQSM